MRRGFVLFLMIAAATLPALGATEQQKLFPVDGTQGDSFGAAVAVDGDTAVIGALTDRDGGVKAGAAYVFLRDAAGFWSEQQKLLASDRMELDRFGEVVALDGDTILIANRVWIGAVYVFTRDGDGFWSELQKLVPANTENVSAFGWGMAIEGDTAIIGAPEYNHQAGAVWVFNRGADGFWRETQKIEGTNVPGPCPFDPCGSSGPGFFGRAVDIDGDTALVGAPFEDDNGGAAYIYKRDGSGVWTEHQRLFAADGDHVDVVGHAVALHGDTAILGAFQSGSAQFVYPGAAYVFTRGVNDVWTERQKLTAPDATEATRFGAGVALYRDTAVISAVFSHQPYVFRRGDDGVWIEADRLRASDDVSLLVPIHFDGDTVVVGAPLSAYMFLMPRTVDIGIHAGNHTGVVNPRDRGTVPIVLFGSEDFDVTAIDVSTLSLGRGGATPTHQRELSGSCGGHLSDVNGDGIKDLMVHFRMPETGIACGDDTVAFSGQTTLGQSIEGSTAIDTVGCR